MIKIEGIDVTFNRNTPLENRVIRGLDLEIAAGQFVTVIGSNGAGKSTLLNVLAGAVEVDCGVIEIDGVDITAWKPHQRAKRISRVFQDPKVGTCEHLTILENFAIAAGRTAPRGLRMAITGQLRDEVKKSLSMLGLGLENRLDDKVGLLSGGQRQAVSLLMGAMGETRILLLDEHTAALDPKIAEFVLSLTEEIVSRLGLTVLMVTHSMAQALKYGDRTIMLHRGQIMLDVSDDQKSNLEVPGLLALFKRRDEDITDDNLLLQ